MTQSLRQRNTSSKPPSPQSPQPQPHYKQHPRRTAQQACILTLLLLTLSLTTLHLYTHHNQSTSPPPSPPILSSQTTPSDNESLISLGVLPHESYIPPGYVENVLACMPTVTRHNGAVEYISNAIKSFRLATNASLSLRKLLIFDMDEPPVGTSATWLQTVFHPSFWRVGAALPDWIEVLTRDGDVIHPGKETLGDSWERVLWRSKEARDYAEVLRRCAARAQGEYVLIVQDDVLFRREVGAVAEWCARWMVDTVVEERGRRRVRRVCAGSLFDIAGGMRGVDGHLLHTSNMVARVWKTQRAQGVAKYLESNFEEMPVDWLADRLCKSQRRRTVVMEPNPVRHRGAVSSFEGNRDRNGLLT